MSTKTIKEEGKGKIFESKALEMLSKSHPLVSAGVYLAVIIALLVIGYQRGVVDTFGQGALIFCGAYLFWSLFEYFFHRYIFHLDSYFPNSNFIKKFDYALHGIHHEFPRDTQRLIMPPVPGLMIITVLFGVFWLVMGETLFMFLPGFLLGYLSYAFIHYSTHAFKPPKAKWLKVLWRHHALHHYKHPDRAFGVSSPIWDYVFRTLPPKRRGAGVQSPASGAQSGES